MRKMRVPESRNHLYEYLAANIFELTSEHTALGMLKARQWRY